MNVCFASGSKITKEIVLIIENQDVLLLIWPMLLQEDMMVIFKII